MKWIKIVVVNFFVLITLLFFSEIAARCIWTLQACLTSKCDLERITTLKIKSLSNFQPNFIGLSRFDQQLGYVPTEGFKRVVNDKTENWTNVKVTIQNDGFRSNGGETTHRFAKVLVVGDSFTFGDQVNDDETWPACLERKLHIGVDNAGVFGYGAAQALKRALMQIHEKTYSYLVFSIVVGEDFSRDRLSYFFGHPRPAVIHTRDGLSWAGVPDPTISGAEFRESRVRVLWSYTYSQTT